jgi:hypothetical protein
MDEKTLEDKLDKLIRVTTRTETQVEALIKANAGTRLTKLETRNKVIQWVGGVAMSCMGLAMTYLKLSGK